MWKLLKEDLGTTYPRTHLPGINIYFNQNFERVQENVLKRRDRDHGIPSHDTEPKGNMGDLFDIDSEHQLSFVYKNQEQQDVQPQSDIIEVAQYSDSVSNQYTVDSFFDEVLWMSLWSNSSAPLANQFTMQDISIPG